VIKPYVIGHRGIPSLAFENTLESFREIKERKIQGTEFDDLLTKDGKLVVYHDFSIFRFFGEKKSLHDLTYEEITKLFLVNFDGKILNIPLLEDVLDLLKDRELINIEIKENTLKGFNTEDGILKLLNKMGIKERVIISSFNPFTLKRVAEKAPEVKRGLLVSQKDTPSYIAKMRFWKLAKPDFIHFDIRMVNDPLVRKFHTKNIRFVFWCVDNINEFNQAMQYNPYALISNVPHQINNYLQSIQK